VFVNAKNNVLKTDNILFSNHLIVYIKHIEFLYTSIIIINRRNISCKRRLERINLFIFINIFFFLCKIILENKMPLEFYFLKSLVKPNIPLKRFRLY